MTKRKHICLDTDFRDQSLITWKGGWGTKQGGGRSDVLPLQKKRGGGGTDNVLAMLRGEGAVLR